VIVNTIFVTQSDVGMFQSALSDAIDTMQGQGLMAEVQYQAGHFAVGDHVAMQYTALVIGREVEE
jgi:hypothetical protein